MDHSLRSELTAIQSQRTRECYTDYFSSSNEPRSCKHTLSGDTSTPASMLYMQSRQSAGRDMGSQVVPFESSCPGPYGSDPAMPEWKATMSLLEGNDIG
jgi:hypothetical protein